jgi:hypothetical protein
MHAPASQLQVALADVGGPLLGTQELLQPSVAFQSYADLRLQLFVCRWPCCNFLALPFLWIWLHCTFVSLLFVCRWPCCNFLALPFLWIWLRCTFVGLL